MGKGEGVSSFPFALFRLSPLAHLPVSPNGIQPSAPHHVKPSPLASIALSTDRGRFQAATLALQKRHRALSQPTRPALTGHWIENEGSNLYNE